MIHVYSILLTSKVAVGYLLPVLAGDFAKELETSATSVRRLFRHFYVQTADADRVLGEKRGDVPGGGRGEDWAVSREVISLAV